MVDKTTGVIYKITNNINKKIYIGKSKNFNSRWKNGHIRSANKLINGEELPYQSHLYRAMAEYGVENFSIEILEECPIEELNDRERFWIKELNSRDPEIGYNICKGGECGPGGPMFAGHHHSEETRRKMSDDRKGDKNSNYGNHWNQSPELRALHSQLSSGENNGMYGKQHSEETKQKIRDSHLGKKAYSNVELDDVKMLTEEEAMYYLQHGYFLGNIHKYKK